MTKKLSILSIVVVFLMSVCLVGCGNDNEPIPIEDYKEEIVGKWKLVEEKSPDGRESYKPDDERIWTFNYDGTCKIITYREDYYKDCFYKLNLDKPEIAIKEKDVYHGKYLDRDWHRITEFSKNLLEIKYYDTIHVFERI